MYYRLSAMMSDREKQKSMANTRPMSVTEFFPSRGGGRSHGRMHQQAYGTFQYQQSHGNMPHQVSQGRFLHTPSVTKMPYGSHGMVPHSASLNHQHQPAQAQLQQHYQQAEGQPDASAFKDESQVPVMYAAWGFDHDGGAARPQINLPSDPPAPPSNRYTARMNPAVASADVSRDFGGGPGSRRVGTAPVGLRPSTGAGSISAARLGMPRMEEARRMESYSTSRGRSLGEALQVCVKGNVTGIERM